MSAELDNNEILMSNSAKETELTKESGEKENHTKARKKKVKKRHKISDPAVNNITNFMSSKLRLVSPEKGLTNLAKETHSVDLNTTKPVKTRSLSLSLTLNKQLNESIEDADVEEGTNTKKKKKKESLSPTKVVKPKFKECVQQANLNSFFKVSASSVNDKVICIKDDETERPLKVSASLFSPKRKRDKQSSKINILSENDKCMQINNNSREITDNSKQVNNNLKQLNNTFKQINTKADTNDLNKVNEEFAKNKLESVQENDKLIKKRIKSTNKEKKLNKESDIKCNHNPMKLKNASMTLQESSNIKTNIDTTDINSCDENIIVQKSNDSLNKTPSTPKRNVFEFMMDKRQKSIGQNSPGKTLDLSPSFEEVDVKKKLSVRRKHLEEWSKTKGGSKHQHDEEAREESAKKILDSRAAHMKEMLKIDTPPVKRGRGRKRKLRLPESSDSSNDSMVAPITKRVKPVEVIIEDTNDDEAFKQRNKLKSNKVQKGLLSFFGVLKNEKEKVEIFSDDEVYRKKNDHLKIKMFSPQAVKKKKKHILIEGSDSSESNFGEQKKKDAEIEDMIKKKIRESNKNLFNGKANESSCESDSSQSKNIKIDQKIKVVKGIESSKVIRRHKRVINDSSNDKSYDSDNVCIAEIRRRLTMKFNLKTMQITESSLDDEDFTESTKPRRSCRVKNETNYIEIEDNDAERKINKNETKQKVASIFSNMIPKPKIDPAVLEARKNFLYSGVPEVLKRTIEKQQSIEDIEYEIFPSISHVQQKPLEPTQFWQLPSPKLTFKPTTTYIPQISSLEYGSISTLKCKHSSTEIKLNQPTQDHDFKQIIDSIKLEDSLFPAYKTYRLLSEKSGIKPTKKKTVEPKRKRGRPKIQPQSKIIEPKISAAEHSMWTEKYRPKSSGDIIGNDKAVRELKSWLQSWLDFSAEIGSSKKRKRSDSMSDFETDSNCSVRLPGNTMILKGPCGSGKTSAVYAVCQELGINVIELNASSKRTGKRLLLELQEATQSHQVRKNDGNSLSAFLSKPTEMLESDCNKMCLLLIEDVDIVFDQDDGFITALSQLLLTSKRPFALLTNDVNCAHIQKLTNQYPVLSFKPLYGITRWLQILCLVEGVHVDVCALDDILYFNKGDIRRTLLQLQFWMQTGGDSNYEQVKRKRGDVVRRYDCEYEDEEPSFMSIESAVRQNVHENCLSSFVTRDQIDSTCLWWNLPDLFNSTHTLESAAEIFDAFSLGDMLITLDDREPCFNRWKCNLEDTLNLKEDLRGYDSNAVVLKDLTQTLMELSCSFNETEINVNTPSDEKKLWRSSRHDCENAYFEAVPLSYAIDRAAFGTDYFSTLRTISRAEKVRSKMNKKRNNRFYNYLKTLNINPSSTSINTACGIFNVKK